MMTDLACILLVNVNAKLLSAVCFSIFYYVEYDPSELVDPAIRRYDTAIRYSDTIRRYDTALRYGVTIRRYDTAIRYGDTATRLSRQYDSRDDMILHQYEALI